MSGFSEIAIIISIAALFGVIARKLKQPELLGYIAAGLFVGFLIPSLKNDTANIEVFSEIGIAFLLFIVGLELNLGEIKKLGKSIIIASIGQIIITWGTALGLALLLRFNFAESCYIAIGLTFSSTIVAIKLLSSNNKLDTLHGKLAVVFLVMQDFAAIAVMIILSAMNNINGGDITSELLNVGAKSIFIVAMLIFVSKFVAPVLLNIVNKERETLFISIIAWALLFSAIVGSEFIGFSIEIGALLAGISLADRYEHFQIQSWMRPLRDFFVTLFFVLLGLKVSLDSINNVIFPIIVLSLFVLIIKPIIIFMLLRFFKYSGRVSFFTGGALSQISEFSLLLITAAVVQSKVSSSVLTIITIVGGITMIFSSYIINYDERIFRILNKFIFKRNVDFNSKNKRISKDTIILLGCHRVGKNILDYLLKNDEKILVVDQNPQRVNQLKQMDVEAIMGDMRDIDFLENLGMEHAKVIISTIPSMEINKVVLNSIAELKNKPTTIMMAKEDEDVAELYNLKADYVVYPYLLTGQKVNMILKNRNNIDRHKINVMKGLLGSKGFGK